MSNDKIIIFCGPSGSGKTTIVKRIKELFPMISASVSATSRSRRLNEIDGIDYHFISIEEFKKKIERGEFVEWEKVYEGQFSGTLKSEVSRIRDLGKIPLFEIDVKGAMNIKKMYGNSALVIFIKVPFDLIKERLISRKTETQETFDNRINRAKEEMKFESLADKVVVNINLQDAINECQNIINNFIKV